MKLAVAVLGGSLALAGCALGPRGENHAAHHPPGGVATPAARTADQRDTMMKSMQDMHDKIVAAKTPQERSTLMQEHMALMQDGMGMMRQMHGGHGGMGMGAGKPMGPEAMGRRMDMMEMMMQMMVDRDAMKAPAPR